MKNPNWIWLVGVLLAAGAGQASPPPGYYLQWSDEFNDTHLNANNWNVIGAAPGQNIVENGSNLVITVYTDANGTNWGGEIDTSGGKFSAACGYYEASMMFNVQAGTEGAFWLQSPYVGNTNSNPTNGVETDIVEHLYDEDNDTNYYNNNSESALHYNGYTALEVSTNHWTYNLGVSSGYHTYGLLWTTNSYTFSVDGNVTWTVPSTNFLVSSANEFIRLTSGPNVGWGGYPPAGGYGSLAASTNQTFVDYARYYAPIPPVQGITWDANTSGGGQHPQDGGGAWESTNWWNETGDIAWNDASPYYSGTIGAGGSAGVLTLEHPHNILTLTFNPVTNGTYTVNGPGPLTVYDGINANMSASLDVPVVLGANQTWSIILGQTLTVNGTVSGAYGLNGIGNQGTLILAGTNSYSGPTTVTNGIVEVTGNESAATGGWLLPGNTLAASVYFQSGSTVVVAPSAKIQVGNNSANGAASETLNAAGTVTNNGSLYLGRVGVINLNPDAAWVQNGPMTLNAFGGYGSSFSISPGATFAYAGSSAIGINPGASGGAVTATIGGTWVTGQPFTNGTSGVGNLVWTNGGTLELAANLPQLCYAGAGSNSLQLAAGGGVINTAGFATTITNSLGGTGGLAKTGPGTLTLSGANDYAGPTTVSAGNLQINGSIGSNTVTVAANATLSGAGVIGGNTTVQVGGSIQAGNAAGAGTLTFGALDLGDSAAAVTYCNFKVAAGGMVAASALNVLGTNVINLLDASLPIGTNTLFTYSGTLGGNGFGGFRLGTVPALPSGMVAYLINSGSAVQLAVAPPPPVGFWNLTPSQTIGYGTANVTLNGTAGIPGQAYPNIGEAVTVTIDGNAQTTTINDTSGDFSITCNTGLIPASSVPYPIIYAYGGDAGLAGTTNTSQTLTVNQTSPLLTATASPIIYGQTLASSSLAGSVATNVNNGALVTGSFAFTTPGIAPNVGITNVTVIFTPADTVDYSPATSSITVVVAAPGGALLTWDASQSTAGAQDGSGVWNSSNLNWFYGTGSTIWSDGSAAAFGVNTTTNCVVTLANDVTPSNIVFNATGGGNYTIAGTYNIWTTDGLDIVANSSAVISAPLTGGGGVTVSNAGSASLTLSGTNTYNGVTTVNGGTVNVSGDQVGATGGWTLASSTSGIGMTVNFSPGSSLLSTGTISLHNTMLNGFSSAMINAFGTVTNSGLLDVDRLGVLNLDSGATWNQSGSMVIGPGSNTSGTSGMTVSNGATFIYSGPAAIGISPARVNTGYARLTIAGGTFITSQGFTNETIGSDTNATITLTNGGTLVLSANIPELTSGTPTNTYLSTGTGTVGGTIDTSVFSTTISNVITGSGNLTKLGAGTLTLSASNTFTGGTTISNGVLLVNGVLGTGPVLVASAGTLGGNGTIGGPVTLNGMVAPGSAAVGTMTTAGETWSGGGVYQFSLNNATNSSGWDALIISGALNLQSAMNNPFSINLVSLTSSNTPGPLAGFSSAGTNIWTLATVSAGIQNFNPAAFAVNTSGFSNLFTGTFTVGTNAGALLLTYTGLPLVAPSVGNVTHAAGTFGFSFSGPAGQGYHLYASTNLALPWTNWTILTNDVFGTGVVNYLDFTTNNSQRFYRIASP